MGDEMTEPNWTLVAKVDRFVVGGHLFWVIIDENGNEVTQFNSYGTGSMGTPHILGPDTDQLRIYAKNFLIPGVNYRQYETDFDAEQVVFTGTKSQYLRR